MKYSALLVPLALSLPLLACNSGPSVTATNASVTEVSNKVKAAVADGEFVAPGRWETVMTIEDMQIPDMPPQMAEKMKAHMGQGMKHVSCLTPEEAKRPKGDFFGGEKECRYDHFKMAGGTIDAKMVCAMQGATRTMTMNGSYSANTYHMAITSAGTGPSGAMGNMSMKMKIDGNRTGVCTGKEDG